MKTREDFSVGTFAVSLQEETLLATLLPERPLSLAVHESCPLAVSLSLAVFLHLPCGLHSAGPGAEAAAPQGNGSGGEEN